MGLLHGFGDFAILVYEGEGDGGRLSGDVVWVANPSRGYDEVEPGTDRVADEFLHQLLLRVHRVTVWV
jgi:hypothetical protein